MIPENQCYAASEGITLMIQFHLPDDRRKAFLMCQLIETTLEPNPAAEGDEAAPPERMVLCFMQAEVIVSGWRLELIWDQLCEGCLAAVRPLPSRYAHLDGKKPYVSMIFVKSVQRE